MALKSTLISFHSAKRFPFVFFFQFVFPRLAFSCPAKQLIIFHTRVFFLAFSYLFSVCCQFMQTRFTMYIVDRERKKKKIFLYSLLITRLFNNFKNSNKKGRFARRFVVSFFLSLLFA